MDDARKAIATLILTLPVLFSGLCQALDMEYVTDQQRQQLETLFSASDFSPHEDSAKMAGKSWTCDMFGVRSHLQVQRDVKLYDWSEVKGDVWNNRGAQLISSYRSEGKALVGHSERLEDRVKITKDGRLISRLSARTPQKVVIAYSVCKSL
jgi:hypothetical protein